MSHSAAQDEDMSMDEILASIRRYVTNDTQSPTSVNENREHLAKNKMQETEASPKIIRLSSEDEWNQSPQNHSSQPNRAEQFENVHEKRPEDDSLISETAKQSTQQAFQKLNQLKESKPSPSSEAVGSKTMDSFIMDLLKPMLKQWVEKNLPTIVERIVEREIQNALASDRG